MYLDQESTTMPVRRAFSVPHRPYYTCFLQILLRQAITVVNDTMGLVKTAPYLLFSRCRTINSCR